MPNSVLEAIKLGIWDFEPTDVEGGDFQATGGLPGSGDKLKAMAERVSRGLPIWHPSDPRNYDDLPESTTSEDFVVSKSS